jgi:hypothetical protein
MTMDSLKQLVTRTRVEGLVILLVALGYLWEANNVPEFYQIPGVPGPTTFPFLLGTVFALCGLWLLISPPNPFAPKASKDIEPKPAPAPTAPGESLVTRALAQWHLIALWVVVLAYLWFMPDLGFPLATFLLLAVFTYLLGEARWHVVLGLAVGATAVIYLVFKIGLNVRLPLGVLEFLFK